VGGIGAAAAGAAGWLVAGWIGPTGSALALLTALLCGLIALGVYAAVLFALDDGDLRPLLIRVLRRTQTRGGR
jgi:hypothetical protein